MFLLNGHGGISTPNGVAAHALAHEEGLELTIGEASYWTVAAQALIDAGARDVGPGYPGHAGGFETSLMLALRPDLVQLERRKASRAPHLGCRGRGVGRLRPLQAPRRRQQGGREIGKRLLEATVGPWPTTWCSTRTPQARGGIA